MSEVETLERKVKSLKNKIERLETNAKADQRWYEKWHAEVGPLKDRLADVEKRAGFYREVLEAISRGTDAASMNMRAKSALMQMTHKE